VTTDSANGIISDCSLFQYRYTSSYNENHVDNNDDDINLLKLYYAKRLKNSHYKFDLETTHVREELPHFPTLNQDYTIGGTAL
jgi:hypothetical protein